HGTSLYPEQTRVPLFVICPGKETPQSEMTDVFSTRAIPSIITQLLGLADSPFYDADLPTIFRSESGHAGTVPPALIPLNYEERKIQSVIWDRWQYLKDLKAAGEREELFELPVDPQAKNNLVEDHPITGPIRGHLRRLLAVGSQTSRAEIMRPTSQTPATR